MLPMDACGLVHTICYPRLWYTSSRLKDCIPFKWSGKSTCSEIQREKQVRLLLTFMKSKLYNSYMAFKYTNCIVCKQWVASSTLLTNSMVWVRERTISTERPPLVGEVIANFLRRGGATWSAWRIPTAVFSVSRQEPLLFYQVAPQLYSRSWVDPVPDPLLFFFW
jgi:hypothetical protein